MTPDDTLTDLLVHWQEANEQGRDLSPTELGVDDPAVRDALVRAITDLRRIGTLLDRIDAVSGIVAAAPVDPAATVSTTRDTATPAPPPPPKPPNDLPALPGFEVLEELGRGGMGIVYRARDLALARSVAVKMLLHGTGATPFQRARFRAEAQAIARLHHPNIVQVFHADEWPSGDGLPSLPFFAMEYVPGSTLGKRLEGKPQPPADVRQLGVVLARAVDAAHRAGVVHRDLKPANVLLAPPAAVPDLNTRWGCPKISDFGLARLSDPAAPAAPAATTGGLVLGTPAYMAPEQAEGRPADIGPATDVWALGVILYELLAGSRPFEAASALLTLQRVCTAEPTPLPVRRPEVPPALARVVERCLQKQPGRRYASAADLAVALQQALTPETTTTLPREPARRRGFGPPTRLAAGLAVGAVLAALVATATWPAVRLPRADPSPAAPPTAFRGWIDILVSDPYHRRPLPEVASGTVGLLGAPHGDGSLLAASAYLPGLSNPSTRRRGLRLHDLGARPLRPADEVHVEVGLAPTRPGYVYIVWVDATGRPIPLYPWQDFDWGKRPAAEQLVAGTLILPANPGEVYPIDPASPAGVETLLLLVRDTPLPGDRDLRALLGALGNQPASDFSYVRWFQDYAVVTSEPDRAPGGRIETTDSAERTQGRLKERLGGEFAFSRAVSFVNRGPR